MRTIFESCRDSFAQREINDSTIPSTTRRLRTDTGGADLTVPGIADQRLDFLKSLQQFTVRSTDECRRLVPKHSDRSRKKPRRGCLSNHYLQHIGADLRQSVAFAEMSGLAFWSVFAVMAAA